MKIIACISQDWKLVPAAETPRDDKQRFAALTAGGHCIVGRKTWEEFPEKMRDGSGGRHYQIVTRKGGFYTTKCSSYVWQPPVEPVNRGDGMESHDRAANQERTNWWVLGGLEIYRAMLPRASMLYLSVLRTKGGLGDFPRHHEDHWENIVTQTHPTHDFIVLRKR